MSKATTQTAPTSSSKMLIAMAGIGTMCALLIVLTYEGTLPRVEQLKAEALEKAIFNVVPGISSTANYTVEGQVLYSGFTEDGKLAGIAIEGVGQGYADKIKILFGYDPYNEKVVGFYVLETKETPGLGDKIEKDPTFLGNFDGLDVALNSDKSALQNAVVTVKSGEKNNAWEVDGITGATISSRAIGAIIHQSMSYWAPIIQQNLKEIEQSNAE